MSSTLTMRKITKKKLRSNVSAILRSNPYYQKDLAKKLLNTEFKELSDTGAESETYYFKLDNSKIINNISLNKGEYVLKIRHNNSSYILTNEEILYLQELSDKNLIPKIFIITPNYIIMKFINGDTLNYLLNNRLLSRNQFIKIYKQIVNLKNYWHSLGYFHGDLIKSNIIVDENLNIQFIDPNIHDITNPYYFNNDNIRVNALAINTDYLTNEELYKDWKD